MAKPVNKLTTKKPKFPTKYTIRVELHDDPSPEDDKILHEAMEGAGFSRTFKHSDGTLYRLPDAEYNFEGDATADQVLNKAKSAAKQTDLEFSVLVTQVTLRRWHNLEAVIPPI